ncbi:MAG TPA: YiiX/YebB-like N1pC/P60 family cysteine hydrolase [Planctomycetota bacterium]|nr:YiiX/YebB-like N1pC/P60 family cysteine hydrolase [Planctomycetota bacterium]
MSVRRVLKDSAIATLSAAYRAFAPKDLPLLRMTAPEFESMADEHEASLDLWGRQLEDLMLRAPRRALAARTVEDLPFEARADIRSHWESVLDLLVAVDRVKQFHEHFAAVSPTRDARRHGRSFVLAFGAFTIQLVTGLKLVRLTETGPAARRLLDEQVPEHGIPPRRFDLLRWNVLHVAAASKLAAGEAYLDTIGRTRALDLRIAEARALLRFRDIAKNGLAILRLKAFDAWFPLQKGVAHWMGETKFRRRPGPLIGKSDVRDLEKDLRPGDILLERRNWNLSNVGLPGFWPHAALYIGGRREVVEALGTGVGYNSLEKSAGADYVAVLRPRLPAAEIDTAIRRAIGYVGRPYDFDFDFLTDAALVCSELVYKCYQPGRQGRGVPFRLSLAAGRQVLPPNDMAAQFDAWRNESDPPLEFVAFLDGREKKGDCVRRDEAAFRASHRRPKWDFLQK